MALGDLSGRAQKLSLTPGFELRNVQPVASPYTGRPSSRVHITLMYKFFRVSTVAGTVVLDTLSVQLHKYSDTSANVDNSFWHHVR